MDYSEWWLYLSMYKIPSDGNEFTSMEDNDFQFVQMGWLVVAPLEEMVLLGQIVLKETESHAELNSGSFQSVSPIFGHWLVDKNPKRDFSLFLMSSPPPPRKINLFHSYQKAIYFSYFINHIMCTEVCYCLYCTYVQYVTRVYP